MKVLVKGRPQKGWAGEYICTGIGNGNGGCGAKLLVEKGDLFKTSCSAMGEVDYYDTFRCPECGVNTDVKGLPFAVRDKLPWGEKHPDGGWCRPEVLSEEKPVDK